MEHRTGATNGLRRMRVWRVVGTGGRGEAPCRYTPCAQDCVRVGKTTETNGSRRLLVITRREGEEVVIGDPKNPIGVVRIASVKGERVRVAFDFPRDVQIHRREVADQITGEEEIEISVIGSIKPAATPS